MRAKTLPGRSASTSRKRRRADRARPGQRLSLPRRQLEINRRPSPAARAARRTPQARANAADGRSQQQHVRHVPKKPAALAVTAGDYVTFHDGADIVKQTEMLCNKHLSGYAKAACMTRSICAHDRRAEIDHSLSAGTSARQVAGAFGVRNGMPLKYTASGGVARPENSAAVFRKILRSGEFPHLQYSERLLVFCCAVDFAAGRREHVPALLLRFRQTG
jgi:hypothetical protein